MDSGRKRRHDDQATNSEVMTTLDRLRNMWQFASLCQWFYIFGGVVKLENLDIDDLEMRCLNPHSTVLEDIGLALLKYLSSHRGLTPELFDEYTRRQFASKAPELPNPFGNDEIPIKFSSFTVFQKIRILHQMTSFVMMNAEKLREKMAEQKDADQDQTTWRIEPFGWDRDDRAYFVLDDNRVYRLTEAVAEPPKPKKNTKQARAQARRNGKRRRVSSSVLDNVVDNPGGEVSHQDDSDAHATAEATGEGMDDGLGGMTWECIAVSLNELHTLLASISSKKDPNERVLHDKIVEHLLPILEQQEERRRRREKERERELLNMAKMANAKRSSRIAGRQEQQKQEELLREEEQKRLSELEALRKQEQKQRKAEKEREMRLYSREKRLHEREIRRAQHKDELAQLSEDSRSVDNAGGRVSERRRQADIEKSMEALKELDDEAEEEWAFDCICGLHGKIDDGQHSVACEKCSIWQHSKCLGIDEQEAEKDDFHFICGPCNRKAADIANGHTSTRPVIRIKINASAPAKISGSVSHDTDQAPVSSPKPLTNPTLGQAIEKSKNGQSVPDAGSSVAMLPALAPPQLYSGGSTLPVNGNGSTSPREPPQKRSLDVDDSTKPSPEAARKGLENLFAVHHPDILQPEQSPRRSHAYGTIHEVSTPAPVPQNDRLSETTVHLSPITPATVASTGNAQQAPVQRTPISFGTPRLQHLQGDSHVAGSIPQSSPSLLPSRGGLSPIKNSPTTVGGHASVPSGGSPMSIIVPPAAALSPSNPEQILMPPVKPEGPAHRQSFSNPATDLAPHQRDPES